MVRGQLSAVAAAVTLLFAANQCRAASRVYQGADDALGLKAQVEFEPIGSDLKVTLDNTSTHDVTQPRQVLTGVFFNILNNPSLLSSNSSDPKATATVLAPNSVQVGTSAGPVGSGGNVGGEWAYRRNTGGGLLSDYYQGISSSGLSSSGVERFGPFNRFDNTQNLAGPNSPNGLQYGIVSAGDDPASGSNKILTEPLIKHQVVFMFPGMGSLDLKNLGDTVRFQYGTSPDDPYLTGSPVTPEPGTWALLGLGAAPIAARLRRRRRGA